MSISMRAELRLHLSAVSSALCDLWLLLASMKGNGEDNRRASADRYMTVLHTLGKKKKREEGSIGGY